MERQEKEKKHALYVPEDEYLSGHLPQRDGTFFPKLSAEVWRVLRGVSQSSPKNFYELYYYHSVKPP